MTNKCKRGKKEIFMNYHPRAYAKGKFLGNNIAYLWSRDKYAN